MNSSFQLACPLCRGSVYLKENIARCEICANEYHCDNGIWRFLPHKRAEHYAKFLRHYHALRRAEGWGANGAAYYRNLPRVSRNDPLQSIWRIREKNFSRLLEIISSAHALKILDVGAGNGWLSNQLAQRGHSVAALDISDEERDGLGVRKNYSVQFECYQAEFDHLPFCNTQFDFVIFNASLHYTVTLTNTLREAKRVITPHGKIVVLDSPFYNDAASGAALTREQQSRLGLKNDLGMVGFLTKESLINATSENRLRVNVPDADNEWHKQLRRKLVQRKLKREPAHFPIILLTANET